MMHGKRWRWFGWLLIVLLWTVGAAAQYYEDTMEPEDLGIRDILRLRTPPAEYVGNDVCRLCHEAAYQTWLGTGHARAFVSMRSRMAMMMGRKEGITACCPGKSAKCLTCHATAHDVPAAARGPGFRMGEGVACEKCHGPGGDHVRAMDQHVADANPDLRVPTRSSCRRCHAPKPSHAAVDTAPFDLDRAWKKIAYACSAERPEDQMEPRELGIWRLGAVATPSSAYVGNQTCAECHGAEYKTWAAGPHAQASRALRSQMGVMMGMKVDMNVVGGPSRNARCLRCHATAHDVPAKYRRSGFRMLQGVGCEKCHGPGAKHVSAMRNAYDIDPQLGLTRTPEAADCETCHRPQESHRALKRPRFEFTSSWNRIAH